MLGGIIDKLTNRDKVLHLTNIVESLEAKAATYYSLESLFLSGAEIPLGPFGSTGGPYSNSWIAYSCISRIARDAAGLNLLFLRDPEDPESELPPTHPLVRLFKRPNEQFTTGQFIEWLMVMLMWRGEFFVLFDNTRAPQAMYNWTDPAWWKEINEGMRITAWEYHRNQENYVRLNDEILFHRLIDPSNPFRGQSPLTAAMVNYQIDTGVDTLQADKVRRGGESSAMFTAPEGTTKTQRDQVREELAARRAEANKVNRDILLPPGVLPVDRKILESFREILDSQQPQADKICAVFGLSKSLLGFEDIDKYATFQGRLKVYFQQTLVPYLRGVEDAFDSYFVQRLGPSYGGYVRFNYKKSPAFQESISEQMTAAGVAHDKGLPWTVINESFNLGLDVDSIPGADQVLVSSALAPIDRLIETWASSFERAPAGVGEQSPPAEADKSIRPKLTNAIIRKRATDPVAVIERGIRLLRLEAKLRGAYKREIFGAMRAGEKIVKAHGSDFASISNDLTKLGKDTTESVVAMISPMHEAAATEGVLSIVQIVEGKVDPMTHEIIRKGHAWRPEITEAIARRTKYVRDMEQSLFDDVVDSVTASVESGAEPADTLALLRERFQSAPGGINRAITIARTEIGSAYNVARHTETAAQGFEWHQWLTAKDEFVRNAEFDHAACNDEVRKIGEQFPCGLRYPMEDGGAAGNVINCRCETIPVLTKDG